MSQPIQGSARVRIEADTSSVPGQVLSALQQAAEAGSAAFVAAFQAAADQAADVLGSIGDAGLSEVADAADAAGDQVATEFQEAADASDAALAGIGDAGLAQAADAADAAGGQVASAFEGAADAADAALGGIGQGGLAETAASAEAAAEEVATAFDGAADAADASLSRIGTGGFEDVAAAADATADRVSSSFGAVTGVLAGGAGLTAALFGAALDAQALNSALATTEQIVKATGGAAGIAAAQIAELSRDVSFRIGVDTVDVQRAANVLLTFRNVGTETFGETLTLAADLAAVLGTDLQGATLQLGKALNDPVLGMTALSRAGVTFTESQRNLVRTLVQSGDLLGAQNIILDELRNQVSGVAEASADSTARIGVAWAELRRIIGQPIITGIDRLTPSLLQSISDISTATRVRLVPAIDRIEDRVSNLTESLDRIDFADVVDQVAAGAPAFAALGAALATAGSSAALSAVGLGTLAGRLNPVAAAISAVVVASPELRNVLLDLLEAVGPLVPALAQASALIASGLSTALQAVVPLLTPIVDLIGRLVDAFTSLPSSVQTATVALAGFAAAIRFAGPIGIALTGIGLLVGALDQIAGTSVAAGTNTQDLAEDLQRLAERGRVTGELLRIAGDDADHFATLIDKAARDFERNKESFRPPDFLLAGEVLEQRRALERIEELDKALSLIVRSGTDADDVLQALAETYQLTDEQIQQLLEIMPETNRAIERQQEAAVDAAEGQTALANAIDGAVEALKAQSDALLAQVDPLFNLNQSLRNVGEAQQAFNDAVAAHGPNSQEARDAAFELTQESLRLQAAVADAAGIFTGQLDPALRDNLRALGLTDSELATVEEAFRQTAAAGDEYADTYLAQAVLRGDTDAIAAFRQLTGAASDYEAVDLAKRLLLEGDGDVRRRIRETRDELNKLPDEKTVQVNLVERVQRFFFGGRAMGGIITRPELSWLAEDNRPEVVIPLTRPERALELTMQSGLLDVLARAVTHASPGVQDRLHSMWPAPAEGRPSMSLEPVASLLGLAVRLLSQRTLLDAPALAAVAAAPDPQVLQRLTDSGHIRRQVEQALVEVLGGSTGGDPVRAAVTRGGRAGPRERVVRGRQDGVGAGMVNNFSISGAGDPDAVAEKVIDRLARGW